MCTPFPHISAPLLRLTLSIFFFRAAEKVAENTEKKFKTLTQENQRLRTTLQSVRLGAQNEVKRFEKEKDKLLERLSKIADSKQMTAQFSCSNLNVSATESRFEKGYYDIALEDAENARVNLVEENGILKKLVVDCANGAQGLLHRIKYRGDQRHMVDEVRSELFSVSGTRLTSSVLAYPYDRSTVIPVGSDECRPRGTQENIGCCRRCHREAAGERPRLKCFTWRGHCQTKCHRPRPAN